MTINGFLKVPDIPGPSKHHGHEDEIEVHGVRFGMEAPTASPGWSRTGPVAVGAISFTKFYDMSSPYLKKALFDNTPLDEVVFSARRTIEDETSDYLVIALSNAMVLNYELRTFDDAPDLIEERVDFGFATIGFRYGDKHDVELDVWGDKK